MGHSKDKETQLEDNGGREEAKHKTHKSQKHTNTKTPKTQKQNCIFF
jgi:hypothetical protein